MKSRIAWLILGMVLLVVNLQAQENSLAQNQTAKIYNFHNKDQFKEFQERNLDKDHRNLLNPEVAKEDYAIVGRKWVNLHQELGSFLKDINFEWDTEASSIEIVHKIYFHKTGAIKAHFFNILNEDIDAETKEKFSESLAKFAGDYSLQLVKDYPYAQCGKTRYAIQNE